MASKGYTATVRALQVRVKQEAGDSGTP